MKYQQTCPDRPTCSSETSHPGAAAAPTIPQISAVHPLNEIRWRRRWEQVHDVDGSLWDVREARETKHGFDLLFGHVAQIHLGRHTTRGAQRLIATPSLVDYWEVNRTNANAIYDLPAGRWALKCVRQKHGFNFYDDRRALWNERVADLKNLTMHDFAQRYNVDAQVAKDWRLRLVGRVVRPAKWWQDNDVLEVLRAPTILRVAAEKLGISIAQVYRLRLRVLEPEVDPRRHIPPRWRTPETFEILRAGLTSREIAEKLDVSASHAQRLRYAVACETPLAA